MRITLIPTIKLAFLCTALAGALLTFSNSASAFSIRDAGMSSGYSEERVNVLYLRPDNSRLQAVLTDHTNAHNAIGSRETITAPTLGGVPGKGTGVPDGGMTAMLLGGALSLLGVARRYIRI
jgi:hypothetical protein